ncbi:hypothetical protein Tco_0969818 [Tanacetum coccineum]
MHANSPSKTHHIEVTLGAGKDSPSPPSKSSSYPSVTCVLHLPRLVRSVKACTPNIHKRTYCDCELEVDDDKKCDVYGFLDPALHSQYYKDLFYDLYVENQQLKRVNKNFGKQQQARKVKNDKRTQDVSMEEMYKQLNAVKNKAQMYDRLLVGFGGEEMSKNFKAARHKRNELALAKLAAAESLSVGTRPPPVYRGPPFNKDDLGESIKTMTQNPATDPSSTSENPVADSSGTSD